MTIYSSLKDITPRYKETVITKKNNELAGLKKCLVFHVRCNLK
jgi:hypothetical protein